MRMKKVQTRRRCVLCVRVHGTGSGDLECPPAGYVREQCQLIQAGWTATEERLRRLNSPAPGGSPPSQMREAACRLLADRPTTSRLRHTGDATRQVEPRSRRKALDGRLAIFPTTRHR